MMHELCVFRIEFECLRKSGGEKTPRLSPQSDYSSLREFFTRHIHLGRMGYPAQTLACFPAKFVFL